MTRPARTGYVWHERFAWHDTSTHVGFLPAGGLLQPHHHYESTESKARMAGLIEVSGASELMTRLPFEPVAEEQITAVHDAQYVARIKRESAERGGDAGDGASPFGPGSYDIARMAAGGTLAALDAVLDGQVQNAYALVRPPGHHAEPQSGMGFCLFSNVGIAIQAARAAGKISRVAIVDIDVHHGNGAQRIFWDDPDVLTVSLHQDRLFPLDSGMREETGGENAPYSSLNVPLPAGSGDGAYELAIAEVAVPAVRAFQPDVVIVSCGFDASMADPLGRMCVTAGGYARMTRQLVDLAEETSGGKLVFSHEGGYSPEYVPFCGLAVVETLAGKEELTPDPFGWAYGAYPVHEVTDAQREAVDAAAAVLAARPW
ncbi:class II histone deacetylase [Sediminivirga luteola]|uniref:Class II histone deacetylase n=1 Tax=Sediminivirga luteola TaxID=1774748 RepID=A0A8J2XJH8_9MICO|nr:class II histone deacetylase [Sediminivirga luteola]GGA05305.1 class II histone deacetylase [Sediminivirga luteola]